MSKCPCPKHPFGCYGHPDSCGCTDDGSRLLAPDQLDPYTLAQCADTIKSWDSPQKLRLAAGEMTAQEMRTALAVVRMLAAAIRALKGDG